MDKYHIKDYARKMHKMLTALKSGKKGKIVLGSTVPSAVGTDIVKRTYKFDYSSSSNYNQLNAALEILYKAAYQEETDQSQVWGGKKWGGFDFEDITSDMLGGLVGYEMFTNNTRYTAAFKTVKKKCDALSKYESLMVFNYEDNQKTMSGKSKKAEQTECKTQQCEFSHHQERIDAGYKDWDTVKGIANGTKPNGIIE